MLQLLDFSLTNFKANKNSILSIETSMKQAIRIFELVAILMLAMLEVQGCIIQYLEEIIEKDGCRSPEREYY